MDEKDPQPGHRFVNDKCIDCKSKWPRVAKTCQAWARWAYPNLCKGCKKDLGQYFKYWHCKECRIAWYRSQGYGYQASNCNEN